MPGARSLDARGYLCPIPTVMASLALEEMATGEVLSLSADDPTTRRDLPAWCAEFGHSVIAISDNGPQFVIRIQKSHAH